MYKMTLEHSISKCFSTKPNQMKTNRIIHRKYGEISL